MAFVRLGRPQFLLGGVAFHTLGAALAWNEGARPDLIAFAWTQFTITAAQLMTHTSNDYFDLAADRLNQNPSRWSGGSRVLPAGALPPAWALAAAGVTAILAVGAATVLATRIAPSAVIGTLLGLAILLAWAYSSPPFRLVATGAGEIAGAILLAALTPLIGYVAQGGHQPSAALLGLAPLVALQFAMLVTVSLPDYDGDQAAGKGTLAVRIGPDKCARWACGAIALAYVLLPVLWVTGATGSIVVAYAVWGPMAAWQAMSLWSGDGRDPARWNRVGFWGIGLVVGSALTVTAGLLASRL